MLVPSIYLNNFKIINPATVATQSQLIKWITDCHIEAQKNSSAGSTEISEKIELLFKNFRANERLILCLSVSVVLIISQEEVLQEKK